MLQSYFNGHLSVVIVQTSYLHNLLHVVIARAGIRSFARAVPAPGALASRRPRRVLHPTLHVLSLLCCLQTRPLLANLVSAAQRTPPSQLQLSFRYSSCLHNVLNSSYLQCVLIVQFMSMCCTSLLRVQRPTYADAGAARVTGARAGAVCRAICARAGVRYCACGRQRMRFAVLCSLPACNGQRMCDKLFFCSALLWLACFSQW